MKKMMNIPLNEFLKEKKINCPESQIHESCRLIINEELADNVNLNIGRRVELRNLNINITGINSTLVIEDEAKIRGNIFIRHRNSSLFIGKGSTTVNCSFYALEGRAIKIGRDCMFSSGVIIRTSDEHTIFNINTHERLNTAQDIIIGNHVWLGEGVTVNKGVQIPDNVIFGSKALITKGKYFCNAIYAGVPAKLIKLNVGWDRALL